MAAKIFHEYLLGFWSEFIFSSYFGPHTPRALQSCHPCPHIKATFKIICISRNWILYLPLLYCRYLPNKRKEKKERRKKWVQHFCQITTVTMSKGIMLPVLPCKHSRRIILGGKSIENVFVLAFCWRLHFIHRVVTPILKSACDAKRGTDLRWGMGVEKGTWALQQDFCWHCWQFLSF